MKFIRKSPTKRPKITGSWDLFYESVREYLRHWQRYVLILAVVAVPVYLISSASYLDTDTPALDPSVSSFLVACSFVMNVAIVWTITHYAKTGRLASLANAYYEGSGAIVRYAIINILLVLMMLPAAFGLALFMVGTLGIKDNSGGIVEELLVDLVVLLLAAPTAYLMVRFGLAPMVGVRDQLRPIEALRRAGAVTRGRFWAMAGRLSIMLLCLFLVSVPITLVTLGLWHLHYQIIAAVFFELVSTLITLPIGYIYALKLYEAFERAAAPTSTEATPATQESDKDAQAHQPATS